MILNMSKVLINDSFLIEGRFSFEAKYDLKSNPPVREIKGTLISNCGYLNKITSIENERYVVTGIHIYKEEYASEEDSIAYYFNAKSFAVADRLLEVKVNRDE